MTTPAAIRQATPRDAFAVAALHLQCGREAGAGPDPAFIDRWADAWLADRAARPFWLAEIENRPLGAVGLHIVDELPTLDEHRGLRWAVGSFLYVTPHFRRCGIAGQLVREANAWAAAHSITRVVADLEPLGAAGQGIGRRLGAPGTAASGGLVSARLRQPVTLF